MAVKDLGEVDNDYFLIPVGIRDHESGLASSFPVENRLLPQGGPPDRQCAGFSGTLSRAAADACLIGGCACGQQPPLPSGVLLADLG